MEPPITAAEYGVDLTIDGTVINPGSVWCHHQDDPYPGGHSYRLTLTRDAAKQLTHVLPEVISKRLDQPATSHFFNLFEGLFSLACRPNRSRPDYVLNTIDIGSVILGRIVVEGVCSPHVYSK